MPVVVGVVVVGAGCSGEQPADGPASGETEAAAPAITASASPSPSSSPSPSESGGPVGKRTPGQFDEATQAEAEAFVEDWWDTVNAALRGDIAADRLRERYATECSVCRGIHQDVQDLQAAGHRAEGADQRVMRTTYQDNVGVFAAVMSVVQAQPGKVLDESGAVVRTLSGDTAVTFVFNVRQRDGSWTIMNITRLPA